MTDYNFNTFGDVVTEAYNEMSLNSSNPVAGLGQSDMEKWANRFSKIFIEKTRLKTQDATWTFRTVADTTLASDAASGATSLSMTSATGFPTTGGLVLLDNIPYVYTAIVGTTMTVSAIARGFDAGDSMQLGYALPTNFGKPRSFFVDGALYRYAKWGVEENVEARFFSIFSTYIVLPPSMGAGSDVTVSYYKKATNTLTSTSTMEIYQMWDAYVIYRLAARGYRKLYDSGKASEYEALAREMLNAARSQIATEDDSVHRSFSPGW